MLIEMNNNNNIEYNLKIKGDPNLSENRIKLRSNIINESFYSTDKMEPPEVKYKSQRIPTSHIYKPFATKTK
jgi:hypothetical protein